MSIGWKQCQRHGPFAIVIENLDRSTPALALTVVDLSKIKDLPLNDLAASAATILHNAPITMLFAVFNAGVAKGFGTVFDGTAKLPLFSPCRKPMSEKWPPLIKGAGPSFCEGCVHRPV
jgi:hypothetical protein